MKEAKRAVRAPERQKMERFKTSDYIYLLIQMQYFFCTMYDGEGIHFHELIYGDKLNRDAYVK